MPILQIKQWNRSVFSIFDYQCRKKHQDKPTSPFSFSFLSLSHKLHNLGRSQWQISLPPPLSFQHFMELPSFLTPKVMGITQVKWFQWLFVFLLKLFVEGQEISDAILNTFLYFGLVEREKKSVWFRDPPLLWWTLQTIDGESLLLPFFYY